MDYHIVSQGKTTIPSVDDGEEMELTDVRFFIGMSYALQNPPPKKMSCLCDVPY